MAKCLFITFIVFIMFIYANSFEIYSPFALKNKIVYPSYKISNSVPILLSYSDSKKFPKITYNTIYKTGYTTRYTNGYKTGYMTGYKINKRRIRKSYCLLFIQNLSNIFDKCYNYYNKNNIQ